MRAYTRENFIQSFLSAWQLHAANSPRPSENSNGRAQESNGAKSRGPTTEAGRLGVWLNASKRDGSISLGGHGATLNLGPRGIRGTTSIPHTRISYVTPYCARIPARAPAVVTRRGGKPSLLGAIAGTFYSGKHVEQIE